MSDTNTIVITFKAPRRLAKKLTALARKRQDQSGDLRTGRGRLIVELLEAGLSPRKPQTQEG